MPYTTLFNRDYLYPAALCAFALTLYGICTHLSPGDDIQEPLQTILISLTTTLYLYIVRVTFKIIHGIRKYRHLAGTYIGYAYKNETDVASPDFYKISDTSQSVATLKYLGDSDFSIKIDVTEHPLSNDPTLERRFKDRLRKYGHHCMVVHK